MKKHDKTREEAWLLLNACTKNKNLVKHALAVEAAMRHYARHFEEDIELWGTVGLLHDFDYEKYPSLEDHPYKGQEILESEGYSEIIRRAIMAHAPHTKTSRDSLLEKIVADFESRELDLEKDLPQFERGLELASKLQKRLKEIENKVVAIDKKFSDDV